MAVTIDTITTTQLADTALIILSHDPGEALLDMLRERCRTVDAHPLFVIAEHADIRTVHDRDAARQIVDHLTDRFDL